MKENGKEIVIKDIIIIDINEVIKKEKKKQIIIMKMIENIPYVEMIEKIA